MYVEHHDDEIESEEGTLRGRLTRPVDYTYQAEMWAQDMLESSMTRRVYAFAGGSVYAVWGRDHDIKSYVARSPAYDGTWELPFFYPNVTTIATAVLGREVASFEDATHWAEQALSSDIATAVLLDKDGVLAAWEGGIEGFRLMSKSPRPLRSPISA
jgi:hypothetical protein